MSDPTIQRLRDEIAQLEQAIPTLAAMPLVRASLQQQRDAKVAELARLEQGVPHSSVDQSGQMGRTNLGANNTLHGQTHIGDTVGGDKLGQHVGSVQAAHDAFVATQQTIHCYYGDQPPVNAATLLSNYLAYFAAECNHLRLQRIVSPAQGGKRDVDQNTVPELRLQAVYTSLTTNGPPVVRLRTTTTMGRVRRFLERLEQKEIERGPDAVRPERVMTVALAVLAEQGAPRLTGERLTHAALEHAGLTGMDDATPITLELQRPELAIEAIALQRWLVLLGEPGSGKSTVLRY
ncbi:MAG: hypothetical protein EI684_03650, partial [Candidatus Viridilinea halotolerans]